MAILPNIVRFEFLTEIDRRSFAPLTLQVPHSGSQLIDPLDVPGLSTAPRSLIDQGKFWSQFIRAQGEPPFVLLAYCFAAPVALATLTALAEGNSGRSNCAILFDPVIPSLSSVVEIVGTLAEKSGDLSGWATSLMPTGAVDSAYIADVKTKMQDRLLDGHGLPEEIAEELADKQASWVSFCLASTERAGDYNAEDVFVVLSDEGHFPNPMGQNMIRVGGALQDILTRPNHVLEVSAWIERNRNIGKEV